MWTYIYIISVLSLSRSEVKLVSYDDAVGLHLSLFGGQR